MKCLMRRILAALMLCCMLAVKTASAETFVSGKAQRFFDRGTAAIKAADKPEDFRDAAAEFSKASAAAPSWPDPYYNAGVALEKAGDLAGAYKAFKSYLKAAPNAADAKQVQKKVNELEYLAEKAEKVNTRSATREVSQQQLLKSLEGAVYGFSYNGNNNVVPAYRLSQGKIGCGTYVHAGGPSGYTAFNGPLTPVDNNLYAANACAADAAMCDNGGYSKINFTLSSDGKTLTSRNNCPGAKDYVLQRLN